MATFGKGNRSIAFNPTTAFPLDARCYFEPATVDGVAKSGLALAEEAAAKAEDVGSKNTVYHYGMKFLVKDGNATDGYTFTWYEITKDKTLVPESLKGVGISKIEKTSTNGLEDTYTITLTDKTTYTFTVTNGIDASDGEDGKTPYIQDGYWYIDGKNQGVKAQGADGDDGITPQLKIGNDNYWYVSYDNGTTWRSLNVKATGKDGDPGKTPVKGEDYYTEADKAEMVAAVLAALPDGDAEEY